MTRHTGLWASFRTRGIFTRKGAPTAGLSPKDQGSEESAINHLAPGIQGPSGAAPAPHDQSKQSVAIRTQDVEVENAKQRGKHPQTLLTLQAENTGTREGTQEEKKRRKNPSKISNTTEPAGPLLEQPSTSLNGGSPPETAVSDQEVLKEVKMDGFSRCPGVWDRRGVWTRQGVWVPALRPTSEDAERAQKEEQLVGDRRSQRREDEVGS